MVSQIDHFDTIVARSEFEALVLECSLIKRHMPKYNILLKDDKGYPYLRVDLTQDYPVMQMVSKTAGDKASYFGPFGGRSVTQHVIDTLRLTLKLPGCSKQFPRDLGKDRPCLNFHMNNCDGWCQLSRSQQDYHARMEQAVLICRAIIKRSRTSCARRWRPRQINYSLSLPRPCAIGCAPSNPSAKSSL